MKSNYTNKESLEFYKEENELLDLRKFLNLFNRQKKLIIGLTSLATSISIVYSLLKVPTWKGTFQIVVSEDNKNNSSSGRGINSIAGLSMFMGNNSSKLETQAIILKSPLVLNSVHRFFEEQKKETINFKEWRNNYLKIDFKKDTNVLEVEYKDKDKKFILETLNLISSEYQDYSQRDRQRSINQGIEYLELQEKQLIKKSRASLKKLNRFSIENGLGDIDGFVELDSSIANNTDGSLMQIQELIENGLFKNRDGLNKSGAGQRYATQFAMLEKYEAEYSVLASNLKGNSKYLSNLKSRIDNLRKSLKRPNEILLEYRTLKRVAGRDENILKDVESRLLALKLEKVRERKPWELISTPTIESKRVTPKRKQIVVSTIIFSILISFLIAKLKEKRSQIIYEKDELISLLSYKFLGDIYINNLFLNDYFLKNNIYKKFSNKKIKFLYLNDHLYKSETNKILKSFSNLSKADFIDFESLKKIDETYKIVLIGEVGSLTKDFLNHIQKYLGLHEEQVIGWIFYEKDATFN